MRLSTKLKLYLIIKFICIIFYVISNISGWDGTYECRDDVIKDMPIFKDAELIISTLEDTNPVAGTIERVYQTKATEQQVEEFYDPYGSCMAVPHNSNITLCFGSNSLSSFSAYIESQNADTQVRLIFQWECGTN